MPAKANGIANCFLYDATEGSLSGWPEELNDQKIKLEDRELELRRRKPATKPAINRNAQRCALCGGSKNPTDREQRSR